MDEAFQLKKILLARLDSMLRRKKRLGA